MPPRCASRCRCPPRGLAPGCRRFVYAGSVRRRSWTSTGTRATSRTRHRSLCKVNRAKWNPYIRSPGTEKRKEPNCLNSAYPGKVPRCSPGTPLASPRRSWGWCGPRHPGSRACECESLVSTAASRQTTFPTIPSGRLGAERGSARWSSPGLPPELPGAQHRNAVIESTVPTSCASLSLGLIDLFFCCSLKLPDGNKSNYILITCTCDL